MDYSRLEHLGIDFITVKQFSRMCKMDEKKYEKYMEELKNAIDNCDENEVLDVADSVREKYDGITSHDRAVLKEDLEGLIKLTIERTK